MEVTLWISYTLLCVHASAFITRGSRGPAYFAMQLGKEVPKGRSWPSWMLANYYPRLASLLTQGALYLPLHMARALGILPRPYECFSGILPPFHSCSAHNTFSAS